MSLVGSCQRCGAPAQLRCTVCGGLFCYRDLDAEERLCADCLRNQKRGRGPVGTRSPPSRLGRTQ